MHLLVSVALLFILLTRGYSLKCYTRYSVPGSCGNTQETCPSGSSKCLSSTVAVYTGSSKQEVKVKSCAMPEECESGSVTIGNTKTTVSTQCCDTDLCNVQNSPDLSSTGPNGKTCFTCNGQSCLEQLKCSGSEDHCIKAKWTAGNQSVTIKGCASKSVCDGVSKQIPIMLEKTCCKGNLCNGAKSVTQSFLLLLCPLLTFFLFQ